ncbi:hypothetical protein C8F04DRAFT_1396874 [Mycena alexandri]|uniref:Uncharacterized protein n=1 Tax=Mycena alexandri TaxID=1745969 RepID=A0AAD6SSY8_9AGAR|nr:hypothetical protein C8F04DRAFT_1396874 [Mycena alexandri]
MTFRMPWYLAFTQACPPQSTVTYLRPSAESFLGRMSYRATSLNGWITTLRINVPV